MMLANKKFEMPFRIPLPDNLPSSFVYAGELLSYMRVNYLLNIKFLGLTGQMPMP